jgi:hypothetical protein
LNPINFKEEYESKAIRMSEKLKKEIKENMLGPDKVPIKKFRDTFIDPKSYEGRTKEQLQNKS